MSRRIFEKKPEIKELRDAINCLQPAMLIGELDINGLSTVGYDNVLKDRLFRFRVLEIDENAPYEWHDDIDLRPNDEMPVTMRGCNVQSFRLAGENLGNSEDQRDENHEEVVQNLSEVPVSSATGQTPTSQSIAQTTSVLGTTTTTTFSNVKPIDQTTSALRGLPKLVYNTMQGLTGFRYLHTSHQHAGIYPVQSNINSMQEQSMAWDDEWNAGANLMSNIQRPLPTRNGGIHVESTPIINRDRLARKTDPLRVAIEKKYPESISRIKTDKLAQRKEKEFHRNNNNKKLRSQNSVLEEDSSSEQYSSLDSEIEDDTTRKNIKSSCSKSVKNKNRKTSSDDTDSEEEQLKTKIRKKKNNAKSKNLSLYSSDERLSNSCSEMLSSTPCARNISDKEKREAAKTFKDWNLKFTGSDKDSPNEFLAAVKDYYESSGLTFKQLLYGLSGI